MDLDTSEQKCSCSLGAPQSPEISVSLPVRMCWSRWGCRGQTASSRWFSLTAGPLQPIIQWIPCHLFLSATGTAMPFASTMSHALGLTVVLTNNALYFRWLWHVFSSFTCTIPFYLAWLHLLWTRNVNIKKDFKGLCETFLGLVVFLPVLWGKFLQVLLTWRNHLKVILAVSSERAFEKWVLYLLIYGSQLVVSALSRAYMSLVNKEIGYLIPPTWY